MKISTGLSEGVGRNHFSARSGAKAPVNPLVGRVLDEFHRAITEAEISPTGVEAINIGIDTQGA